MKKGEATRREIIQKAAPIFNQKGYEGASLSGLMRATGLGKGGIYRHFKSKEQLAAEAFDFAWEKAIERRLAGTEVIANSVDRLKLIIRNFRERREGLVPGGCPLLNTAVDSDDGNLVLRAKAKRALRSWLDRLSAIVVAGQKKGEIKAGVDAGALANLIVMTLEGSLMLRRLQKDEAPTALACRHLEEHLEKEARN
jgi:TetR/AcrR family transcriptional repressor of nem operon